MTEREDLLNVEEQQLQPAEQLQPATSSKKLSIAAAVSVVLGLAAVGVVSRRDLGADVAWSARLPQEKELSSSVAGEAPSSAAHPGSDAANWVAEPWSACSSSCDPPIKARVVSCVRHWDGVAVADEHCSNQTSPDRRVECSCELEVCFPDTTDGCALPLTQSDNTVHSRRPASSEDFEEVGCFELAADDDLSAWEGLAHGRGLDWTCLGWAGKGPCRSGLPFFRSSDPEHLEPLACFSFCIHAGLDLAGVVNGAECRCGASVLNQDAWHGHAANTSLTFPFSSAARSDPSGGGCPIRLLRYTGFFQFGGVPLFLTKHHLADSQYVDSIVAGRQIVEEADEPKDASRLRALRVANDSAAARKLDTDPAWTRNCYPEACGPSENWDTRVTTKPSGINTSFREYTIIPYWFKDGTDDTRKAAFREAVKTWSELTCIICEEKSGQVEWAVEVGNFDPESCYASLGKTHHGQINLGWCNDMSHVGSMIHEIGHTIGMLHEQSRQDAQTTYHGHGPFLTVYWQNLDEGWDSEYLPSPIAYIGSSEQQKGDPEHGYSPYDFESLMHYYQGGGAQEGKNAYDTIPPSKVWTVGQRDTLSPLDIVQANDMYQCISDSICQPAGRTYLSGPGVANSVHKLCGTWRGTFAEAKDKCDCTEGCEVLHDFGCDGRGWRVCTATIDALTSESNGKTGACTAIVGTPRTYAIGPMVTNWVRRPEYGCDDKWTGTLAEAKAKCDSLAGCSVLHDYGCDGRGWRVCKASISVFHTKYKRDRRACTRVLAPRSYITGPGVSVMRTHSTGGVDRRCGSWMGTLQEAKNECDSLPGCSFIHDYGCDNRNWRACTSSIDDFPPSAKSCTMKVGTPTHSTYSDGPKVTPSVSGLCGSWYGTLEEAKSRCSSDPMCKVLHDYGCDNRNWRVCSAGIGIFPGVPSGKRAACTKTRVESTDLPTGAGSYAEGPEVSGLSKHCGGGLWMGTLAEAKAKCDGTIGCNVLHDSGCDNQDWRFCTWSIGDFPAPHTGDGAGCTMERSSPQVCAIEEMTMKTKQYGNEIGWLITPKDGPNAGKAVCEKTKDISPYEDNNEYTVSCCLTLGTYTLTCKDHWGDGWHGGSLTINGKSYCGSTSWNTAEMTVEFEV